MNAVILAENGVQDEEYLYPYYRLQEAGMKVEVATPRQSGICKGKYGIPIRSTMCVEDLDAGKFDLVIVPGGWECPEKLRQNEQVLDFIREMYAYHTNLKKTKKIIAAICHGPWVLISAGIVRGHKMTCYKGMKDDLINAGATYVDASCVCHENIITSPHYRDNPEFMKTILQEC